jgi:hypothetical protein
MRLDANGATRANAAASIGMRGLLEAVRRKFPWVMAAPATNVSTPYRSKIETLKTSSGFRPTAEGAASELIAK